MKMFYLLICLAGLVIMGCSMETGDNPPKGKETQAKVETKVKGHPGLNNVLKVSDLIYSGSEPEGDTGFASIARLGVKTIVSVDGAKPNLELAAKHGLKYVHIPIGYDGIPDIAGDSLARLMQETKAPVYIHCHHGKHRGPAAAAVACIASGMLQGKEALGILQKAGTGKEYPGLWEAVEKYIPPKPGTKLPELVSVSPVNSFAAAMARLDRHYDNLVFCQKTKWKTPADHPDLVPVKEAAMVKDCLQDSQRFLSPNREEQFKKWLSETQKYSEELEQALQKNDTASADRIFPLLEKSCNQCHTKYRN